MGTGIQTDAIPSPRAEVLAEVRYTHREEDFVSWWMFHWEQMQDQRFNPVARRFVSWIGLMLRIALVFAFLSVVSCLLVREKSTDYIFVAAACVFCCSLVFGLMAWFLRGPKGFLRKLARRRYRRKVQRLGRQLVARKTYIHLGRSHSLRLTAESIVHLIELHEVVKGSTITERKEIVTPWLALDRIDVTEDYAFLIEQRNYTTILPRRAFLEGAAYQQFVELARRLHRAATQSRAPEADWKPPEERLMTPMMPAP